jgi:hypothetical protein
MKVGCQAPDVNLRIWGHGPVTVLTNTSVRHSLKRELVLLFTSFFSIPLARQCFFDAALFAGLQVVGVTFDFLDDVFLLNLPLKPTERILKRLAFLYANLCQMNTPPDLPYGSYQDTGFLCFLPIMGTYLNLQHKTCDSG